MRSYWEYDADCCYVADYEAHEEKLRDHVAHVQHVFDHDWIHYENDDHAHGRDVLIHCGDHHHVNVDDFRDLDCYQSRDRDDDGHVKKSQREVACS